MVIFVNSLLNIAEFIGGLHPLMVHLPIGILLLAGFFRLLTTREKFASLRPAVGISLLLGMLSAVVAGISGFLLSRNDDYDFQLVTRHQWFGISVAVISLVAYLIHKKNYHSGKWIILLMVILVIITGHLGGSLTHGTDYLTKAFSDNEIKAEQKPIPNVQEAVVYADIIQPLFESKCYTCHNAKKKKGGLRLDEPEFILKGGKDGEVIKPGNPEQSDMIKRLMLPRSQEDHMPPKEKPQLKESEIALIHWWISTGASFDKKTKELEQPESIKPILLDLQNIQEIKTFPDVPAIAVEKANDDAIQKLKQRGVVIVPVAQNSNYLLANFVTIDSVTDKDLDLLYPLKKQLVWLKLGGKKITDEGLVMVGQLTSLTRLQLDNTLITDKGLGSLLNLNNLQYLNLVATNITAKGVMQLKSLPQLRSVYLYKTEIATRDWANLRNAFPKTIIDSGGYNVPTLESDTTIVRPPQKN